MSGVTSVTLSSNTAGLGGTGFIGGTFPFKLSDMINASEITNLYDQFRILKATLFFKWQGSALDTTQLQTSVLLNPPVVAYYRDYDDNTTPTANEFHERAITKYRRMRPGQLVRIDCTPAVLISAFESVTATAYLPKWRQWIDVADSPTPHYGLKFGWEYPASTAYGNIAVWYQLTFQCKGQR